MLLLVHRTHILRTFELFQWEEATKIVKKLIRENNILGEDDVLILSHLDELLSRKSVSMAKHCQFDTPVLYGALIMPMGNLNFAFRYFYLSHII